MDPRGPIINAPPRDRERDPPPGRPDASGPEAGGLAGRSTGRAARWSRALRERRAGIARSPSPAALLEAERLSGNGPFWLAFAMALGAAHYALANREPHAVAVVVLIVLTFAGWWVSRGRRLLGPALSVAAAFAVGLGLAKYEAAGSQTRMMVGEATTRVEGVVEALTVDARGRTRYDVRVTGTRDPELQFPPSRARLFVSARHERLSPGARFEAVARLRQPSGPARPGGYDFGFHAYHAGMGAYGFVLGRPEGDGAIEPTRGNASVSALRLEIATTVRSALDGAVGGIAAALLTGDRRGIPDDVAETLRATGLAHMLAISGLHMALVAGVVLAAMRGALVLVPGVAARYSTRKLASASALVVATSYLVLSGMSVSAQRAWIMLCVVLLAVLCDRSALTMRNVGIAGIIVIAISPHAVVGPGFQMSFAATAALIAAYGAWRRRRIGRDEPLLPPLARVALGFIVGLAVTSAVAGAATAPFAAYHFQRFATLGLFANLLAMPLVSVVVMPAGVLAMLTMPFGAEGPFLALMGWALKLVVASARWVEGWGEPLSVGALAPIVPLLAALGIVLLCGFRTRLALLGLIPLALALRWPAPAAPDIIMAENARLAAVRTADRWAIASSRKPDRFVLDQWLDAFPAEEIAANAPGGFACSDRLCTIAAQGARIALVRERDAWGEACDVADIVVVPFRLRGDRCASGATLLHAASLNRTGALVARIEAGGSGRPRLVADQALPVRSRPWTEHRYATVTSRRARPPDRAAVSDSDGRGPRAVPAP